MVRTIITFCSLFHRSGTLQDRGCAKIGTAYANTFTEVEKKTQCPTLTSNYQATNGKLQKINSGFDLHFMCKKQLSAWKERRAENYMGILNLPWGMLFKAFLQVQTALAMVALILKEIIKKNTGKTDWKKCRSYGMRREEVRKKISVKSITILYRQHYSTII